MACIALRFHSVHCSAAPERHSALLYFRETSLVVRVKIHVVHDENSNYLLY